MAHPLLERAIANLRATITQAIRLPATQNVLVIFDEESPLARLLVEAYRVVVPGARFEKFVEGDDAHFRGLMQAMQRGDLVVLVQSTNFRLNEFRIRIELFKLGLATIEHVHLGRMSAREEEIYIDALAYDEARYHFLGKELKRRVDGAHRIEVRCAGTSLVYETAMEPAKLNIGDYREMTNVGGTFPIGEVFSEPVDFSRVNGDAFLFGFAGMDHQVQIHEPFRVEIREGILRAIDAPKDFQEVLTMIAAEEQVMVREFGLGMNQAMGKLKPVADITAFERMNGLHLSLGEKHGVYKKPGLVPRKTRFHVDVFVDVAEILIDDEVVFLNGQYLPNEPLAH